MYNKSFFNIAFNFLLGILANLSQQLQSDITNGKTTLDDQVLQIKKNIVGGGTIDLIDATTERIDEICSFDKNKLQTGRAFIFDKVSIGYRSGATTGLEGKLAYNVALPAELQNATLIINQNGRDVLRLPVIDLHNLAAGEKAADQYTELDTLRHLLDDKSFTMQIKFAPGVSLPVAAGVEHYICVRLKGAQTTVKVS
jgi:hypothetical protein